MTRCFVSAIYGDHDSVKTAPVGAPAFMVVGDATKATEAERNGWLPIVDPRPHEHPRMASKRPKWDPSSYRELDDFPVQCWIDGSYIPLADVADVFDFGPWSMFPHPMRDCLLDEADVSRRMAKYNAYRVREQARHYVECGMPEHWGLWENGLHVRDLSDPGIAELVADVWTEVSQWGAQCQIASAWCSWYHDRRPIDLPGTSLSNRFAMLTPHKSER